MKTNLIKLCVIFSFSLLSLFLTCGKNGTCDWTCANSLIPGSTTEGETVNGLPDDEVPPQGPCLNNITERDDAGNATAWGDHDWDSICFFDPVQKTKTIEIKKQ